jgi:hypothetical protein
MAAKGTGKGLWKAVEMPIPKNFGPRIRPIEMWGITFDPKVCPLQIHMPRYA